MKKSESLNALATPLKVPSWPRSMLSWSRPASQSMTSDELLQIAHLNRVDYFFELSFIYWIEFHKKTTKTKKKVGNGSSNGWLRRIKSRPLSSHLGSKAWSQSLESVGIGIKDPMPIPGAKFNAKKSTFLSLTQRKIFGVEMGVPQIRLKVELGLEP